SVRNVARNDKVRTLARGQRLQGLLELGLVSPDERHAETHLRKRRGNSQADATARSRNNRRSLIGCQVRSSIPKYSADRDHRAARFMRSFPTTKPIVANTPPPREEPGQAPRFELAR